MSSLRETVTHPAMRSGVATAAAYAIILVLLTIGLFLIPYGLLRFL